MRVEIDEFTSKDNDYLVIVRTLDEETNEEVSAIPFYCSASDVKEDAAFRKSIEGLPDLLEEMYNLGLEGSKVSFERTGLKVVNQ